MNCQRCHHTDEAHRNSAQSTSLMKLGQCQIPACTCMQYLDSIKKHFELEKELLLLEEEEDEAIFQDRN